MNALTEVSAKAMVEYNDSNDANTKVIRTLKSDEKIKINVEKFGWEACEIQANDTKSAIHARCYVDKKRNVYFSCWGDETVEIFLQGNGLAAIKLICTHK